MNSLTDMGRRILVLGCPGSGKSTFARKLYECTGIPLTHLDNIWWKADRTHITRDEFDSKLEKLLREDAWILDGDYSRTYEIRIRACDTIIFLDYSEETCMRGIVERVGTYRTDIPWSEQRLDPELAEIVRNYRRENRPSVYALMEKYPMKRSYVFQKRLQAEAWLQGLHSAQCNSSGRQIKTGIVLNPINL